MKRPNRALFLERELCWDHLKNGKLALANWMCADTATSVEAPFACLSRDDRGNVLRASAFYFPK